MPTLADQGFLTGGGSVPMAINLTGHRAKLPNFMPPFAKTVRPKWMDAKRDAPSICSTKSIAKPCRISYSEAQYHDTGQKFLFDLQGYLLLENVLSPDEINHYHDAVYRLCSRKRQAPNSGTHTANDAGHSCSSLHRTRSRFFGVSRSSHSPADIAGADGRASHSY